MNSNHQVTLKRLTNALDKRYHKLNGELCDIIDILEKLLDAQPEGSSIGDELDNAIRALVLAANMGTALQHDVSDVLRQQLAQAQSAKRAYEQGWDARLLDLLGRATPEQARMLRELLINDSDDDGIPF